MTRKQYREAIEALGFESQIKAGRWMGLSPRQGQRYALGESEIPGPVVKLLRLMLELGLSAAEVDEILAD